MASVRPVSIVIPVYNEEENIKQAISDIRAGLDGFEYELIVVDDSSSDATQSILSGIEGIVCLRHARNKGYGASLKTGIGRAKFGDLVIIDGDNTYPAASLKQILNVYFEKDEDMTVAARTGKNVSISLSRRFAKGILFSIANFLAGKKIPDWNSGMRVMKKDAVTRFFNILPDGFSFTTTISLAMLTNGYNVNYVSIDYLKRRGASKIKPIKDTAGFFQLIIRTVLYFNPLKVFIPFSLALIVLAFTILFASVIFLGQAMDVTFGVMLMASFISMAIGMLADLIVRHFP